MDIFFLATNFSFEKNLVPLQLKILKWGEREQVLDRNSMGMEADGI